MPLQEALKRIRGLHLEEFDPEPSRARVRLGGSALRLRFLAEKAPDPRRMEQRLGRFAASIRPGEIPVLYAPFVRPGLRRQAENAGVGWLDDFGNCHLESGEVLVHVERPLPRGSLPKPHIEPFSPSGSRVLRVLLQDHGRVHRLKTVSEDAGVHVSSVSRALNAMVRAGYVERSAEGWRVSSPGVLLDAWIDHLRGQPPPQEYWFYGRPESPQSLASRMLRAVAGKRSKVMFSGLLAAELLEPLVPAWVAEAYVHPLRLSELKDSVRLIEAPPQHANVRILHNRDVGVFVGGGDQVPPGIPVVGRAQLVADLYLLYPVAGGVQVESVAPFDGDPRAVEVADSLRRRWGLQ